MRCSARYAESEFLQTAVWDLKSDIWSVGCICYELCTGRAPYHVFKIFEILQAMNHARNFPYSNPLNIL